MGGFLIRIVINAIAIAITASLLPGIEVINNDIGTLLILGLIFGIVNAIVKPILMFMTCPAVILTLGLFILVINGLMLMLVDSLAGDRLSVDGFGWAVLGGIVMALVSMVLESLLGMKDEPAEPAKRG